MSMKDQAIEAGKDVIVVGSVYSLNWFLEHIVKIKDTAQAIVAILSILALLWRMIVVVANTARGVFHKWRSHK
jgi:hypothetical protein